MTVLDDTDVIVSLLHHLIYAKQPRAFVTTEVMLFLSLNDWKEA
jgi:hypothetical protein